MSSDLKHEIMQSATNALQSPEAVKGVGLIGVTGNVALWFSDNLNIITAIITLLITCTMFYYSRKKTKADILKAEQDRRTSEAQEKLLLAQIEKLKAGSSDVN